MVKPVHMQGKSGLGFRYRGIAYVYSLCQNLTHEDRRRTDDPKLVTCKVFLKKMAKLAGVTTGEAE